MNNQQYHKAVDIINKSTDVLITTHTKPDGDAVGCCVALSETLKAMGKKAQILLLSSLPQWYGFLLEGKVLVLGHDIDPEQLETGKLGRFDLIIIADTNSYSQLPKLEKYLKQKPAPVLIIDHHTTADGLGDVEIVDTNAPAASLIVFELLKFAKWPVTPKIAEALFVGIATDTGWFHFNNTDAVAFRASAELDELGAKPSQIYHSIFQSYSPQRLHLMTAMLNTLELHFDDRCATQHLTQQDFKNTGAKYEDTENLIDECRRIGSVEISALFVELTDGRIRCSLRSNGGINVCQIAQKFGGGGHPSAAGTFLPAPVDNAKLLILNEVKTHFVQ